MSLRFDQPLWLLVLLLIIPTVVSGWRMLDSMTRLRRIVCIVVRSLLLSLLTLLLAGLSYVQETNKVAVVAVVDESDSIRVMAGAQQVPGPDDALVSVPATEAMQTWVRQATRLQDKEDLVGVITFDGLPRVQRLPSSGPPEFNSFRANAEGSGIEAALRLATAVIPFDASGRIVLLSDGNETSGNAVAAAQELGSGARRVPIDVVPVKYAMTREVVVTSLDAPPRAAALSTVSLRVVLEATTESRGVLRLLDEGVVVPIGPAGESGREVTLSPGVNVERLSFKLPAGRVHRFSVVFEPQVQTDGTPAGDTRLENNRADAFTLSPGRGAVLLITSSPDPQNGALARALRESDLEVTIRTPAGVPDSLLEYDGFHVIMLDDVAADEVPTEVQENLVNFVRDMGGGLVMMGGQNSFAAGGWKGSRLEPILPVNLDVPDRIVTPPTATVFVLDNSGSMGHFVLGSNQTQQSIANDAAALAALNVGKRELLGVVVFNSNYEVLRPLTPNRDPEATAQALRTIAPGGGTNLGPALQRAGEMLDESEAKVKQVVVMTDGRSQNADAMPALATELARRGVRVTAIGVGDAADAQGLDALAKAGGGEYHQVTDPRVLPRIFLRVVKMVRQPLVREEPFSPVFNPVGSPYLAGIMPPQILGGLNLAQLRREPTVVNPLVTKDGEPVLAHWNAGLGQVIAFTSNADAWAAEWRTTESFSSFWSQLVRLASRPQQSNGLTANAVFEGGRMRFSLDAVDGVGDSLDGLVVSGAVVAPSGTRSEIRMDQVAPGRYEGVLEEPEPGASIAMISAQNAGEKLPVVVVGATSPRSSELKSFRDNATLLERVAGATGGRVLSLSDPQSVSLFRRDGLTPRRVSIPLAATILRWLVVLVLVDLAVRRVAWDRWLVRDPVAPSILSNVGTTTQVLVSRVGSVGASESFALGEDDARQLAAKARDERRARRLAQVRTPSVAEPGAATPPAAGPQIVDRGPTVDGAEPGAEDQGLLAAKRRAKERFNER